jgi:hypothetical protein
MKNKVGRPRKYKEETITVAFRIPKSLKEELKEVVRLMKKDFELK